MTINNLVKTAHDAAVKKGFYGEDKNIGELLMLVVSELGEALEAHRYGRMCGDDIQILSEMCQQLVVFPIKEYEANIQGTFEEEIADTFIRLGDLCGYLGINIEMHIKAKMEYNKTRPEKHGKDY